MRVSKLPTYQIKLLEEELRTIRRCLAPHVKKVGEHVVEEILKNIDKVLPAIPDHKEKKEEADPKPEVQTIYSPLYPYPSSDITGPLDYRYPYGDLGPYCGPHK